MIFPWCRGIMVFGGPGDASRGQSPTQLGIRFSSVLGRRVACSAAAGSACGALTPDTSKNILRR
jgi:hypothetical protein